jgi:hypothetical protein
MTNIAAGQLRTWARNIRQAADDLFPPGELAHADHVLTDIPDDTSASELLTSGRTAGAHRLVARDNLYSIATALEEAADS